MNLNDHDKALLIALRLGKHFKNKPGNVFSILRAAFPDIEGQEVLASQRRLIAKDYAWAPLNQDYPKRDHLSITDAGMAAADLLIAEGRKLTFKERLINVPRSDWIALGALLVSLIALFKS